MTGVQTCALPILDGIAPLVLADRIAVEHDVWNVVPPQGPIGRTGDDALHRLARQRLERRQRIAVMNHPSAHCDPSRFLLLEARAGAAHLPAPTLRGVAPAREMPRGGMTAPTAAIVAPGTDGRRRAWTWPHPWGARRGECLHQPPRGQRSQAHVISSRSRPQVRVEREVREPNGSLWGRARHVLVYPLRDTPVTSGVGAHDSQARLWVVRGAYPAAPAVLPDPRLPPTSTAAARPASRAKKQIRDTPQCGHGRAHRVTAGPSD